ncbi:hypothetical protein HY485_05470 [Candidatus Woesearchaeota archaeon]|nr:hypothetical protein [Candidatus Woesearchaeota archaeon]
MTPKNTPPEMQALIEKYKKAILENTALTSIEQPQKIYSRAYELFRQEALPKPITLYEKLCKAFGKFNIKIPSQETALQESISISHLAIKPSDATSFAIIFPIILMMLGIVASAWFDLLFYVFFSLFGGIALITILIKIPHYIANKWRMAASNQMVLCIFYVVTYMRHTSNLERALEFAAQYLAPPLSLDFKKILWDVEIQRYDTVKESLEFYLETWRKWNNEFVEAFHLIESSLYEASEERRLTILDKSLDVILDGTKEKMLHYVQNLKSPITTLHMLGVILPILGLVILPLVVNFSENIQWWHLATIYNLILPTVVFILGKNILANRPTGYGDTDITKLNPAFKKYQNILLHFGKYEIPINPLIITLSLASASFLIAASPLVIHTLNPEFDLELFSGFSLIGYRESIKIPGVIVGPYGLGASILSIFYPLTFVFGIGLWHKLRTTNVIKIRERTKKLEDEFASALFQLGNRLGDGLPAEIAFPKVADVTKGTASGYFFQLVSQKLALGAGLQDAVNDAVTFFPSNVIRSSMRVLVESIKKGPATAAQALLNISRYIKEIHQVNERLKDLLADIISDMRSQITFLTPVIAGIVIGITSMITFILSALAGNITNLGETGGGTFSDVAQFFGDGIPTYYFQIVVGIYVFQLSFILTIIANGIENGADKLNERYMLGKNTIQSTTTYAILAIVVILLFNTIASNIVGVAGVLGK